ncbi:MAG: DUF4442 domain-containing protein [Thalassobium sp.]|nr:MAG: DUF4442 domain-containing protein [Thalassobium sp.]
MLPLYRRTGGRFTFVTEDMKTIRLRVKLNWKTRNYVGAIFGGSMYGATDPIYMFQFIHILGSDYVVWDKSSTVEYRKPGKSTVFAEFIIDDTTIENVKAKVAEHGKFVFELPIDIKTKDGTSICYITKTLYVASKEYYSTRLLK